MEEDLLTAVTDKELPGAIVAPLPSLSNRWTMIIMIITMIIIMITRPKPAYGRQGLAGLWGQDTDQAGTFWGVVNISLRAFSAQLG